MNVRKKIPDPWKKIIRTHTYTCRYPLESSTNEHLPNHTIFRRTIEKIDHFGQSYFFFAHLLANVGYHSFFLSFLLFSFLSVCFSPVPPPPFPSYFCFLLLYRIFLNVFEKKTATTTTVTTTTCQVIYCQLLIPAKHVKTCGQ